MCPVLFWTFLERFGISVSSKGALSTFFYQDGCLAGDFHLKKSPDR
jgi:hypothetical protein